MHRSQSIRSPSSSSRKRKGEGSKTPCRVEPRVFELCQLLLEKQELLHSGRGADESGRFLEGQFGRSRRYRLRGRRNGRGLFRFAVSFGAVHVVWRRRTTTYSVFLSAEPSSNASRSTVGGCGRRRRVASCCEVRGQRGDPGGLQLFP